MRTLVLWDIDSTLVEIGSLSAELYAAAFEAVLGRHLEHVAEMPGRTDRAIIGETLRLHGIEPTEPLETRFADALSGAFQSRRSEIRARGRALRRSPRRSCARSTCLASSIPASARTAWMT